MIYRFEVVCLAFLGQDMSKFNVCAQIYMPMCSFPCFNVLLMLAQPYWARICLNIVFLLRSMYLGAFCHVHAQIYIFICSLPCLCLDLHIGCYVLCLLQPFISCYAFFLCFGPQVGCRSRSCGLGLHPYTQAYIKEFG